MAQAKKKATKRKVAAKRATSTKKRAATKPKASVKKKAVVKKKATPKNGARKRVAATGARTEYPHPIRMRGALLAEYRVAAAEVETAHAQLKLSDSVLIDLSQDPKYAVVFEANKIHAANIQNRNEKAAAMVAVLHKVGKKFGINFSKLKEYAFNPETGVITFDPPQEGETP